MSEAPLYERVGFDYVAAMNDLLAKFTYSEIAAKLGYKSTGSITAILKGHSPAHQHGEALWALYIETFNRKPPLSDVQNNANSLTTNPV